jgi:hypothetical protein
LAKISIKLPENPKPNPKHFVLNIAFFSHLGLFRVSNFVLRIFVLGVLGVSALKIVADPYFGVLCARCNLFLSSHRRKNSNLIGWDLNRPRDRRETVFPTT